VRPPNVARLCISKCLCNLRRAENPPTIFGVYTLSRAFQVPKCDSTHSQNLRIRQNARARGCYTFLMAENPKRAPRPRKMATPEQVRKALERAKRLLAPTPEKLKEMPTTSKRVH
jgi:hypothetical protein